MSSHINDRLIWLGFGVALFFAAQGIRYAIRDMVLLTEIDLQRDELPDDALALNNPEDSIGLETLRTLASSPNANIANSARSIIVDRFARLPNATAMLSADANSSSHRVQQQVRMAFHFLTRWPAPTSLVIPDGLWTPFDEFHEETGESFTPRSMSEHLTDVDDTVDLAFIQRPALDPSEWDRRSRRREAMVFHEGDGEVGEEDIIRPQ